MRYENQSYTSLFLHKNNIDRLLPVYIMDFILLCWLCLSDSYILFIMKTTHLGHYRFLYIL